MLGKGARVKTTNWPRVVLMTAAVVVVAALGYPLTDAFGWWGGLFNFIIGYTLGVIALAVTRR